MPFDFNEKQVFITASIGIAASEGYNRPEDIVRDSDIAMYKAKFSGRGLQANTPVAGPVSFRAAVDHQY